MEIIKHFILQIKEREGERHPSQMCRAGLFRLKRSGERFLKICSERGRIHEICPAGGGR